MSGGFKWIELGIHQCVFSEEDGKVLGHIITDAPSARKMPIRAYVDGKEIGLYVNEKFARAAVEEAMVTERQNAGVHGTRIQDQTP